MSHEAEECWTMWSWRDDTAKTGKEGGGETSGTFLTYILEILAPDELCRAPAEPQHSSGMYPPHTHTLSLHFASICIAGLCLPL